VDKISEVFGGVLMLTKRETDFRFVFVSVTYIVLMLISNIMAVKLIDLYGIILTAAVVVYPFSFMLGDVLTELYGFKTARKVILLGFSMQVVFILLSSLTIAMPYPNYWTGQEAITFVFSTTPRICAASVVGYLLGSVTNAWSMVKIGRMTRGKHLYMRTIGSSVFGEIFDTVLFIAIAFWGTMPLSALLVMMVCQYTAKILIEAVCGTPLAYMLINKFR
jgi:uncharacterized integral membrane protein (TIGR00697 family)